jgi:hypothetical protein
MKFIIKNMVHESEGYVFKPSRYGRQEKRELKMKWEETFDTSVVNGAGKSWFYVKPPPCTINKMVSELVFVSKKLNKGEMLPRSKIQVVEFKNSKKKFKEEERVICIPTTLYSVTKSVLEFLSQRYELIETRNRKKFRKQKCNWGNFC